MIRCRGRKSNRHRAGRTLNATRSVDEFVRYNTVGGCFFESAAREQERVRQKARDANKRVTAAAAQQTVRTSQHVDFATLA